MTHSIPRTVAAAFVLGVGLLLVGATAVPDVLHIGHFSMTRADSNGHPIHWRPIALSKVDQKTQYTLVEDVAGSDTVSVVRAVSDGGASGLVRERRLDPADHPILSWRWKVNGVLDAGDATTKDGDDYPARIYVTFDYDPSNFGLVDRAKYIALQALGYDQIPTRALNYIWANRVPKDTILPNAYTDWVQMVAVESGSAKTGTWVLEQRNVRADYRKAFGEDPPPINGIAIMTDTDNTDASATAHYGDIVAGSPVRPSDTMAAPSAAPTGSGSAGPDE